MSSSLKLFFAIALCFKSLKLKSMTDLHSSHLIAHKSSDHKAIVVVENRVVVWIFRIWKQLEPLAQ